MPEQLAAVPAPIVPDLTIADAGTLAEEGVGPEVGAGQPEPPVSPRLATG